MEEDYYSKFDDLLITHNQNVEIAFNQEVIDKFYNEPEIGIYNNDYLNFSIEEMILVHSIAKNGDEFQNEEVFDYDVVKKSKQPLGRNSISFLLRDEVIRLLPKDVSEETINTICQAVFLIGNHYISYLRSEDYEESYWEKKESAVETVKFLDFLKKLKKEESEILRINITTVSNSKTKPISFPLQWFNIYLDKFESEFNKNSAISVDEFYEETRSSCVGFINSFPKSNYREGKIIKAYVQILEKIMIYYNVSTKNKRHGIIGSILFYLRIFDKAPFQHYAHRVKQMIQRKK